MQLKLEFSNKYFYKVRRLIGNKFAEMGNNSNCKFFIRVWRLAIVIGDNK